MFNPFNNLMYSANVANNPYFNPVAASPNPWYAYPGVSPVDLGFAAYLGAPAAAYCVQSMPNQYAQYTDKPIYNPIPYTPNVRNMEKEKQKKPSETTTIISKHAMICNKIEVVSTDLIPFALKIDGVVFVPVSNSGIRFDTESAKDFVDKTFKPAEENYDDDEDY